MLYVMTTPKRYVRHKFWYWMSLPIRLLRRMHFRRTKGRRVTVSVTIMTVTMTRGVRLSL